MPPTVRVEQGESAKAWAVSIKCEVRGDLALLHANGKEGKRAEYGEPGQEHVGLWIERVVEIQGISDENRMT